MGEQAGELRVAFDSSYPPFSEGRDGDGSGLLLDLWRAIARNAGMQLCPVFGVWHEALDAVLTGRADAHGGLLRSPEREEHFAFSVGLFSISTFLFVRGEEQGNGLRDFASRRLGAVAGSHEYEYLTSQLDRPDVVLFDNNELLLRAAIAGDVPAIAVDYPVAKMLLERLGREHSLRPVEHLYSRSLRAAVPSSRRDMLPLLNTAIESLSAEEIEAVTEEHMPDLGSELLPDWLIPTALAGGAVLSVSYLSDMVNRLVRERDQLARRLEQSTYWREELERRFSNLAGSIPGFVYRCRADERWSVEYISDGCRHLTGYDQEDFLERPNPPGIAAFVHEEDETWLHEMMQNSLQDGRLIDAEYRMIDRYGTERWVLERGRAVRDEHGSVRFIEGLITDITHRKSAEARAQENARLQRLIGDVIFELASAIPENLDAKLQLALSWIVEGVGAARAYIMRSDDHLNTFRLTHSAAVDGSRPPAQYLLHSEYESEFETLAAGMPVAMAGASGDSREIGAVATDSGTNEAGTNEAGTNGPEAIRPEEAGAWWFPIMQRDRCRGLLGLDAPADARGFPEPVRRTMQIIINLISEVWQRVELQEELKRQSLTDPLTGAYNRRFFEQRIAVAQDEYEREGRHSAVIMLDLDRFKQLNDTHGHHVGDTVLCDFASAVADEIRPSDVFARYGGEEFVVLLSATGLVEAGRVAERIRSRIAAREVAAGDTIVRYTVSAGVAATDEAGNKTPKLLLDLSDRRLYMAKAAGRNNVVSSE